METIAEQIKKMEEQGLAQLVSYAGSKAALGRLMGVTRQSVNDWHRRGRVSMQCAIDAERVTGGAIKKEDLLPSVRDWSKTEGR